MAENKEKKGVGYGWIIGVLGTLLVLIIAGIAVFFVVKNQLAKKPKISSSYIVSKLEDASDLTTARLQYTGLVKYDDEGIPFLTQKKYSMIYSAEMEAGIDLSKVEVGVSDDLVIVKLPDVVVEEPVVDPDSVEFYDESFALFNWDSKQDGVDAIKIARKDCKEKADTDGLKAKAYENAKELVGQILGGVVGDRDIVVE